MGFVRGWAGLHDVARAGPRDVVAGGALKAEVARGVSMRGDEPPVIRGVRGGLPRKNFQNLCI